MTGNSSSSCGTDVPALDKQWSSSLVSEPCWSEDPYEPLLSLSQCGSDGTGSHSHSNCAACSGRRKRHSRAAWLALLMWAVPLVLAGCKSYDWWYNRPHQTNRQPAGRLLLVQVVFRHGARTPLSHMYWTNASWSHCSQLPLEPTNTSSGNSSSGGDGSGGSSGSSSGSSIRLQLYDPSGAPHPPDLSGDEEPQLPGGCRMGHLTDVGFQNALDLGAELRQTYIQHHKLLPAQQLDLQLLHAESTAVQRTVTTLRGVLSGLYPNSSAVVPVAVRSSEREVMGADLEGCPVLANRTQRLLQLQSERDASDPKLREFQRQVITGLGLGLAPDTPLLFNRLRDELACMQAEGQEPPAAAANPRLVRTVDYVTTHRRVETSCPDPDQCLLGKDAAAECRQATALTIGRLLHTLVQRMDAAARSKHGHRAVDSSSSSSSSSGISSSGSNGALSDAEQQSRSTRRMLLEASVAAVSIAPQSASDGGGSSSSSSIVGPSSSPSSSERSPKLMLYSAHDTTLLPLLAALGQQQDNWPGFTGHLAFELWGQKGGQFHVRVLHNGEPLKLPLAADNATGGAGVISGGLRWLKSSGAAAAASGVAVRASHGLQAAAAQVAVLAERLESAAAGCVRAVAAAVGWGGAGQQGAGGVEPQQLSSNGEGAAGSSGAHVVSLADFQQRVLGGYIMSQKDYVRECGASGGVARGADSRARWLAQFY